MNKKGRPGMCRDGLLRCAGRESRSAISGYQRNFNPICMSRGPNSVLLAALARRSPGLRSGSRRPCSSSHRKLELTARYLVVPKPV